MSRRWRQRGFSLAELMIAATLGLVSVAAAGSLFLGTARGHRQDDRSARLHDSLRFAMAQLTQDLEMAGFWASVRDPRTDVVLHPSVAAGFEGPCSADWVFGDRRPLQLHGNAEPAAAHATFPCIAPGEFQKGTDVVAIKRLRGTCAAPAGAADDRKYFLRTDGLRHVLYQHAAGVPPPAPAGGACAPGTSVEVYEYLPAIWFIRRYPVSGGPLLPSLCRKSPMGDRIATDCLAEGIEDLQLELGVDTDGDGVADAFRSFAGTPEPALLERVVAVRVHLLARTAEPDPHHHDAKTYALADVRHAPADGHRRKVLSSTVLIRNSAHRLRPSALPG